MTWPSSVIFPSVPRSWCRMMASATASACAAGAPDSRVRFSARMPPNHSNDSSVPRRFSAVVPMSWRRQANAHVESET